MIGPLCLCGLGLRLDIAKQLPGNLGSINPPCDMDHLCGRNECQIKELDVVVTPGGSDDIRFQRYACVHGTSVGVLSTHGDWAVRLWGAALWAALIG